MRNGDSNDGVDDLEPAPDASGGVRRGERGAGRHRLRDAVGRDGKRELPDPSGRNHVKGGPFTLI